jgi:hypothetical protein
MFTSPGVVSDPSHFTIETTLELDSFFQWLIYLPILAVSNLGMSMLTTKIAVNKLTVDQQSPQVTLTQCPVSKGLETRNCAGVSPFLGPTGSGIGNHRERNLNVTSMFLVAFRHEPSDQMSFHNKRPSRKTLHLMTSAHKLSQTSQSDPQSSLRKQQPTNLRRKVMPCRTSGAHSSAAAESHTHTTVRPYESTTRTANRKSVKVPQQKCRSNRLDLRACARSVCGRRVVFPTGHLCETSLRSETITLACREIPSTTT